MQGYLLAIMMVLELPPRLSLRRYVRGESLYGMKGRLPCPAEGLAPAWLSPPPLPWKLWVEPISSLDHDNRDFSAAIYKHKSLMVK